MSAPTEWFFQMQQDAATARAFVVKQGRTFLERMAPGATLSTTALAEELWSPAHALGEATALRRRMVDFLMKAANAELADCAFRGPPTGRKFMGKVTHPWLWTRPRDGGIRIVATMAIPRYTAELSEQEIRVKLIEIVKTAPAAQYIPAAHLIQIVDVLLSKAKVSLANH